MGLREYNYVVNVLQRATRFEDIERAITRMGFDLGEPEEADGRIAQFRKYVNQRRDAGLTEEEAVREAAAHLLERVGRLSVRDGEHKGIR